MTADGVAPPRAGRPDDQGVDLFAAPPAPPAVPAPRAPEPGVPAAEAPGQEPHVAAPGTGYTVEHRVSPAHRRPPPIGGARPRTALVIAIGMVLTAGAIAAVEHGTRPAGSPAPPPIAAAAAAPAAPAAADAAAEDAVAEEGLPADLSATEVVLPTLGVRSRLVGLDVGPGGALEPPADPAVAGWYRRGGVPGEPGPTVVVGHVDSHTGPAVFYRLDELAPGDRVEVARSDGRTFAYEVVTVEQYPKTAFPTARVYGPTPGPELHLITCGGDFDRRSRHYRDNVVVTAIPA